MNIAPTATLFDFINVFNHLNGYNETSDYKRANRQLIATDAFVGWQFESQEQYVSCCRLYMYLQNQFKALSNIDMSDVQTCDWVIASTKL